MDPFVAEIRIFPFNFAPTGWAWCNGQLLPIDQNTALFKLLGNIYGGDGTTTFALPNLQGSVPIGAGQGTGLSNRPLGSSGGSETVTLLEAEMPAHTHTLQGKAQYGSTNTPSPNVVLAKSSPGSAYAPFQTAVGPLSAGALTPAGGNAPHNNMQPFITFYFCIAMQGVYPPSS